MSSLSNRSSAEQPTSLLTKESLITGDSRTSSQAIAPIDYWIVSPPRFRPNRDEVNYSTPCYRYRPRLVCSAVIVDVAVWKVMGRSSSRNIEISLNNVMPTDSSLPASDFSEGPDDNEASARCRQKR
ncbi:hypothetical protein HAX54_003008 [Datura stramonium]|uniref:Uncharacterized protein n=1 Tax=Datura stramonium TaxID=4076 RepID=A0ABS8T5T2_DATST|nr:hypothetical protein [Datura stramonium]